MAREGKISGALVKSGLVRLIPDKSVQTAIHLREARWVTRQGAFRKAARSWDVLSRQGGDGSPRYMIISGALLLFELKGREGAPRIARGFRHPSCKVKTCLKVCSVPRSYYRWIEENYDSFSDEGFWIRLCDAAAEDAVAADRFRQRLALLVYLSEEPVVANAMFEMQRRLSPGGQSAVEGEIFAWRSAAWCSSSITAPNPDGCDPADLDAAAVYDLLLKARRELPHAYGEAHLKLPISAPLRQVLAVKHVWIILAALQALQRREPAQAIEILAPALAAKAGELGALERRPPVRKIFIGGFGWSGSSAVHDAIRGYPGVKEMPGAGDVPHLNEGADSEAMYIQGPAGLGELRAALNKDPKVIDAATLWSFFRLYVLGVQPHSYVEYKSVHATRNLQSILGELYFLVVMDMIHALSKAMAKGLERGRKFPAAPFQRFSDLLTKALTREEDRCILFNNAVTIANMEQFDLVDHAVYVAVGRDIRDQFSDQRRCNIFFNENATNFAGWMRRKRRRFESTFDAVRANRPDLERIFVQFERFVLDEAYRAGIAKALVGYHDAAAEALYFIAEQSARNIGIYGDYLSPEELSVLGASELTYDSRREESLAS